MPTNDYFRVAAQNIRQGMVLKRQEIESKRREINEHERETNQVVQKLQDEIRRTEAEIAKSKDEQEEPDKDRAQKMREVLDFQKQITDKQHAHQTFKDRTIAKMHEMERELAYIEQQAKELEAKS